ncbi:DNA-binding transcriptional ArsR family regulator [Deinobacterium chartae]|uniref:DNA-binding transcriptional ArsR family regulator n=1 Tax=Deinobacterium chartae TaxID=521158 RepID=A0A841I5L5_9DEIO|nr:metalloregulator ArsR/SmtB family transcription factor [Deinobacterium chartae]MBB6099738.1 DNA-binding transcriptional ArsR family regulator [Deinobacterium chartae]
MAEDKRSLEAECEVTVLHPERLENVRRHLPTQQTLDDLSQTLKLLADPTRLLILSALLFEELCVCDLAALTHVNESTMSHQLRLLRLQDLVQFRKVGRIAYYRLSGEKSRQVVMRVTGITPEVPVP